MAGTIILTSGDKRIKMSNNQWARRIGSNWQKLRIGMRFGINDGGSNIGGNPQLAFGLCSGTTNFYGDATANHFLGWRSNPTAIWNRQTSADKVGYYPDALSQSIKQIGATITVVTSPVLVPVLVGPSNLHWGTFFMDFLKGSPWNTTMWGFSFTGNIADHTTDPSKAQFLAAMIAANATIVGDTDGQSSGTPTIDEATNGELDSMNLFYNVASPTLEILDIAAARLL